MPILEKIKKLLKGRLEAFQKIMGRKGDPGLVQWLHDRNKDPVIEKGLKRLQELLSHYFECDSELNKYPVFRPAHLEDRNGDKYWLVPVKGIFPDQFEVTPQDLAALEIVCENFPGENKLICVCKIAESPWKERIEKYENPGNRPGIE